MLPDITIQVGEVVASSIESMFREGFWGVGNLVSTYMYCRYAEAVCGGFCAGVLACADEPAGVHEFPHGVGEYGFGGAGCDGPAADVEFEVVDGIGAVHQVSDCGQCCPAAERLWGAAKEWVLLGCGEGRADVLACVAGGCVFRGRGCSGGCGEGAVPLSGCVLFRVWAGSAVSVGGRCTAQVFEAWQSGDGRGAGDVFE
ncbi:hypothetical protein BO226_25055 (plasmid) [Rhodococcus sp. 2G]|nr:hypothetical protein BO226_25055 [Rhodococcus sp. 2G]